MGAGIAQVILEAGDHVDLYDPDPSVLDLSRTRIGDGLHRRATRRGDADPAASVAAHLDRLTSATSLAAVASATDIVIEAAIEDLEAKRAIFGELDGEAAATTILATNTSALRVRAIAAATTRPDRVIGLHFFNPPPLMALVEVVATDVTHPAVVERATAMVRAWGKTPIRSADTPGFIVNRVNRPFTIEALRLLEAGTADVVTIDEALRAAGFPMGPFELMDLAGLDVNLAAARSVWEGLGRPERLRPSSIQERLVAEGRLGRKVGEGFYRYDDDGRRGPLAAPAPAPRAHSSGTLDAASIVSRITDAIDAEAGRAAAEGVASRADIDLALRLGAGHPLRSSS